MAISKLTIQKIFQLIFSSDVMSDAPHRLPTTSEVNENILSAQNSQLAVYNAHDGNNSLVKSSPGLQHLNRNINLNLSSEPGSVVALNTIQEINLSRRPSALLQDLLSTRRPSAVMAAIRTPNHRPRMLGWVRNYLFSVIFVQFFCLSDVIERWDLWEMYCPS